MRQSTLRPTRLLTNQDTGACMQLEKFGPRFSGSCCRNWLRNMDTRMTCTLPLLSKTDLFHMAISTVPMWQDFLFPSMGTLWWCSKSSLLSSPEGTSLTVVFQACCERNEAPSLPSFVLWRSWCYYTGWSSPHWWGEFLPIVERICVSWIGSGRDCSRSNAVGRRRQDKR